MWHEAVKGASTMLPLLIGYLPFALTIGVAAGSSSDRLAAWAGALLIFGGSAHLSVIELVGNGSGVAAAVGTGLLINSRLMVYSASLLSLWQGAPLRYRLLAAAVVIDPTWLIASRRQAQPGTTEERRAFFGGAAMTLAAGWSAMIGAGDSSRDSAGRDVVPGHLYAVVLVGHRRPSPANCGRCALCLRSGSGRSVDIDVAVGDRTAHGDGGRCRGRQLVAWEVRS